MQYIRLTDLASELGVHRITVERHAKNLGIVINKGKVWKDDAGKIIESL